MQESGLVERRNSHWRCVTYIQQLQHICSAQELLQLCFSVSFPFSLMLSLPLQPFAWCFSISLRPSTHSAALLPSSSAGFQLCLSSPSRLLLHLLSLYSPACSEGVTELCHSLIVLELFCSVWIKSLKSLICVLIQLPYRKIKEITRWVLFQSNFLNHHDLLLETTMLLIACIHSLHWKVNL